MSKVRRRRWAAGVVLCYVVACVLQPVVSWAIAYFVHARSTEEDVFILERPQESDSNIAKITVTNERETGYQQIRVVGWSKGYRIGPVFRGEPGEPLDSNPAWPLDASEVHPVIVDAKAWPLSAREKASFLGGTFGETLSEAYLMGWPMKAVYGVFPRDHLTGKWSNDSCLGWKLVRMRWVPFVWRPLLKGWIVNTFVHGSVLAALGGGVPLMVGWILQVRRHRIGKCRGCGYDLSGSAKGGVCPECGRTERKRTLNTLLHQSGD